MFVTKNSEQIQPHTLLVVSDDPAAGKKLSELAAECGFVVLDVLPHTVAGGRLNSSNADVLIVNASSDCRSSVALSRLGNAAKMSVLILCGGDTYERCQAELEAEGILAVKKPASRETMRAVMRLLSAVSVKLGMLEKSNNILLEKMEDIKVVNRAKWLLIGSLGMTEREAHYHIEKQAMDMRLPRREIAETIIRTYDK